jgi:hypothetical protein
MGVKRGVVTKVRSRKSNFTNATYVRRQAGRRTAGTGNREQGKGRRLTKTAGTWDSGLGTGGGMRINSDDCMKTRLAGRRPRIDARGGNGQPGTENRPGTAKMAGIRDMRQGPGAAGGRSAPRKKNAPLGGVQVRSVERCLRNNCPLL